MLAYFRDKVNEIAVPIWNGFFRGPHKRPCVGSPQNVILWGKIVGWLRVVGEKPEGKEGAILFKIHGGKLF